jgi:hypothetical protein
VQDFIGAPHEKLAGRGNPFGAALHRRDDETPARTVAL